ncbi:hypothetical protein DL768_008616 [Monosporascus sp. mg162]|nr:hypothetical protein DL768_008616 [Monosporascus sp. mg162]
MLGASAWLIWQVTKSAVVMPRLIQAGLIPANQPSDQPPHILRDTTPHWLRPTVIQRSSDYNAIVDCIPWPSVRDRLILFQSSLSLDEIVPSIWIPLGTAEDRSVSLTEGFPHVLPLFCNYEEQSFRNTYYGCLGIWKVSKTEGNSPPPASYMVDEILGNGIVT